MKRLLLTAFAAAAFAAMPGATLVALAEDGPFGAATGPDPSFRPPAVVLRHVDAPSLPLAAQLAAVAPPRELVVLVGGYQTCAASDRTFAVIAAQLTAAGYDVRVFGRDPRYPYDSYGSIDPSARSLRDEIRSLSSSYGAIHIVTHSMGGAVTDRAFAQGLSRHDGVVTYVSLSGPHSGSFAAEAATLVGDIGPRELVHRIGSAAGFETDSDAVRDLATLKPVPPPAGVVRLDLRAASDLVVTGRDARDPGVVSRDLVVAGEGHGAILSDPTAVELTLRTIATRRIPPDGRSQGLIDAADRQSHLYGALALCAIVALGAFALLWRFTPVGGTLERALSLAPRRPRREACA